MSTAPAGSLVLRDSGVEGTDAIVSIMEDAFDRRFGEAWTRAQCIGMFGLPGVWATIAYKDEVPCGFAMGRIVLDDAELLLIAVRTSGQHSGIGAQLLAHMVQEATRRGGLRLHLEVRDGNRALDFYEMSGFSQVHRRRDYYKGLFGETFDALTLSRDLSVSK